MAAKYVNVHILERVEGSAIVVLLRVWGIVIVRWHLRPEKPNAVGILQIMLFSTCIRNAAKLGNNHNQYRQHLGKFAPGHLVSINHKGKQINKNNKRNISSRNAGEKG